MALPNTPQNVYVQTANAQVLVSWDILAGATSYVVQRSTDGITFSTVSSPTSVSYLDTAVTVGTQYYYQVAAANVSGTGSYSAAQAITPTKPGQMSLGQLRLLSQQKADRVNSNFVTLPEWNTYINQSYFELYDLLVQKYGNDYFVSSLQITTSGGLATPLPDGINNSGAAALYKLLGVDLALAGSTGFVTLKKYEFIQRNDYVYPQLQTNLLGFFNPRYRLVGNNIAFIPTISAGQNIQLWYVPRLTALLQDTDVADGVSGWTEYIAVDAAIKALMKEEADISALLEAKNALMQRIECAAENRDAGAPERISDTRGTNTWGNQGPVGGI